MEDTVLDREEFCYVTTVGRRTGKPHTIEIWFAAHDATLYILAGNGDRADFVQNLVADPSTVVKIGEHAYRGAGRIVTKAEEMAIARELIPVKYAHREEGLEEWAQTALPIAIDINFQ
ncbi:MAG TPA: nitroreductase family deazaflavin-dependent oxidoreductase [Actinomycetota bacterium]|nr:nitroreductase family deazaflavin-dependent oxidoreductase [Actinomycetota bacterium]